MSDTNPFDFDRFTELLGDDVVAYMEPIVYNTSLVVTPLTVQRLLSELDSFDEYHLVYALEIGARHAPRDFATMIPRFLADGHQSVRLAASRILGRLPDRFVTPSLVEAARTYAAQCPEDMTMEVDQLQKRIS